jgi:hypothetical protein
MHTTGALGRLPSREQQARNGQRTARCCGFVQRHIARPAWCGLPSAIEEKAIVDRVLRQTHCKGPTYRLRGSQITSRFHPRCYARVSAALLGLDDTLYFAVLGTSFSCELDGAEHGQRNHRIQGGASLLLWASKLKVTTQLVVPQSWRALTGGSR